MKLTSGEFSGINLFTPKGYDIRPTLARTRQSVFNMIRPSINDSVVVDCFAGTGAFGLEALGNGAAKVLFLENRYCGIIDKNAFKLRIPNSKFRILNMDFEKGLKIIAKEGIKADILFADPPYNRDFIRKLLKTLSLSDILNDDALLILEVHRDEIEDLETPGFVKLRKKKYGDTYVLMLKKQEAANG